MPTCCEPYKGYKHMQMLEMEIGLPRLVPSYTCKIFIIRLKITYHKIGGVNLRLLNLILHVEVY